MIETKPAAEIRTIADTASSLFVSALIFITSGLAAVAIVRCFI